MDFGEVGDGRAIETRWKIGEGRESLEQGIVPLHFRGVRLHG